MAKLSDDVLLTTYAGTILGSMDNLRVKLHAEILARMPERMGKVDVAGIAQKVSFECNELMGPISGAELVAIEAAVTLVLRSHLEGKSESK